MTTKTPTILVLIFLVLTACSFKHVPQESFRQTIDWVTETPASIKERLATATQQIEILSAFFQLNMNPPPEKMMSSMSGVITVDARESKPKIRIRAFQMFGSILFDTVTVGDETKIYVPRRKTMYVSRKAAQKVPNNKGPQAIFASMMIEPSTLAIRENMPIKISGDTVRVFLEDGWMDLAADSGLITAVHKRNVKTTYSKYTHLAGRSLIPTQISTQITDGSYRADCTLSKLSSPQTLPVDYFELAEYKPAVIKDLQELQND